MILKALILYFQALFTEMKNLDRLPRYDASKLAPTRTFSPERKEKSVKNLVKIASFSHLGLRYGPKIEKHEKP